MKNVLCKKAYFILLLTVLSPFGISKRKHISKSLKYILQWSKPNENWLLGRKHFKAESCPVNTCFITADKSYLNNIETNFDAIVFDGSEISKVNISCPKHRSPHQKYIFATSESAGNYPLCDERYDDFFNWTMTYKLDSDIYNGYITIKNSKGDIIGPKKTMHWMKQESMKPIDEAFKLSLRSKSKAAVWFVSNCKQLSPRKVFVSEVQKELDKHGLEIDIFGDCSAKKCPKERHDICLEMVRRDYYFYFALENSFVDEYVTEKLRTALMHAAIPVVFGGANYSQFMPEGIYLHGGRLTPREVAKEMVDIIMNKERYYSFFRWTRHYSYHRPSATPESNYVCHLCAWLHDERRVRAPSVHPHLLEWWNPPGTRCDRVLIAMAISGALNEFNKKLKFEHDAKTNWPLFGNALVASFISMPLLIMFIAKTCVKL